MNTTLQGQAHTAGGNTASKGQFSTPSPKILAVDDRSENLVALKVMLKNIGAELIAVTSGELALKEILRHEFALILMDVQMPEMDGFETASLIREYEPAQHVPLIFVTAINKDQVYIKKGYDLGAIDYVCKPVEPDILRSKVRGFLQMYHEKIRLREVTETLQQTQRALESSYQEVGRAKSYLENVIGSMAESLIVLDTSFMIQASNPATNRLLGYDEGELLGKPMRQIISEETFWDNWQDQIINESTKQNQELFYGMKDGSQISVLFSMASMQKIGQESLGYVCLAQDITEQKRTAEELALARDSALEGMKAKAAFLATMSHEIRTPMNGVIGMAEFLLDSELTAEQRDYVETLKVSGEALLTVINDILDFSKIEAGKMSLETLAFPLRKVVEDVMDLIAIQAHPKGLEVVTLIHGNVPFRVEGDPGRLRQVLLNLLSNAVKFTKTGEVALHVNVISEDGEAIQCRFDVVDTGIGMSPDVQTRVFTPFSQGDESTAREFGGTGLGLIISQKLVNLMGGKIEFESQANHGTRMWFTLGLQPSTVPTMFSLQPLPPFCAALSIQHRHIVLELEKSLQEWGGDVQSIGRKDDLISALLAAIQENRPFDVLIVEVSDFESFARPFFQELHQTPSLASLRVMVLTALGKPGDGKLAKSLGAAAYITKPIKQDQLHRGLRLVMGKNLEDGRKAPVSLVTRHTILEQQGGEECRVLLAEDNLVNQKVAVRMLKNLGYAVDVVMNGREALEAVKGTTHYRAILMDCMMPEMDGYDSTRAIRAHEQATSNTSQDPQHVPIIAVTANAFDGDKEQCMACGMDDFLVKPITTVDLQAVLEKWVRSPKSPA